jgi:putative ABC transport system substrate-binding protein
VSTRRQFISLLGGAAAWPLAARAQQPAMPVIGLLSIRSPENSTHLVAALRSGLSEMGYVENANLTIESRWALGDYARAPALAAELVARNVAVIVATGGELTVMAAKAATSTIPIVFMVGRDPIELGLATSYNKPGGNATGLNFLIPTLELGRLTLLRELVPQTQVIGVLLNPKFPLAQSQLRDVRHAARAMNLELHLLRASTSYEIESAFEVIAWERIAALLQISDPFFLNRRAQLVALATRYRVPTMYDFGDYPAAGGLMSYGIDLADAYRQVGVYAGRILKGANPAELPIVQPNKFEFIINLKTAKTLGLEVPSLLRARADEVIE